MALKLSFLGAARNVTGSCYLAETGGARVLVDCGLYQERDLKTRNWDPFPFEPRSIDAVLLTHAHLDHCGLLPRLVREGFRGRVHCTPATADIASIVMLDAGKIQEEDAAFKKKRHEREGRQGPHPEVPLYTVEDAQATVPRLAPGPYQQPVPLAGGLAATFHEAGHILGSTSIVLRFGANGSSRTVLFSGDIGRWDVPILRDPTLFAEADYVVTESTYGTRDHESNNHIPEALAEAFEETFRAGGNVVIPSFAVERSQEILYHLHGLVEKGRLPRMLVFVDSPMAVRVTEVFRRHPELFDEDSAELLRRGEHPCDFPGLTMCRSVEESKAINQIRGSAVIIAGSGMCTGGRIKHHLANNITRPECTLLFVGHQAVGTLGRQIADGAGEVRILGQSYPVRARVRRIEGFSGHAGRGELLRWIKALRRPPRRVFVTHGEAETAVAYAQTVARETGWNTSAPAYREEAVLE